jgi:hypothetical protein
LIAHEFIDENIGGGNSSNRTVIRSFAFSNAGNLFAYSVGNMIKVTKTDLVLVNVTNSGQNISNIPLTFMLDQNYPNPFNPVTLIKYHCARAGDVSLKVYDILGNEVETLVNSKQEPGNYSVNFDGSNFPSGVYYYRLEAGDYVEVKKMILLK